MASVAEFIADLGSREIKLSEEPAGSLVVQALPGRLTDADRERFRRDKPEILAELARRETAFDPAAFHDALFDRRIALWVTAEGRVAWHETDVKLSAVGRANIHRNETALVAWLTSPPSPEYSAKLREQHARIWGEIEEHVIG